MRTIKISQLLLVLKQLCCENKGVLLSIDGRCGSGKSTLANQLIQQLGGTVIRMDDFYLPPHLREKDWLSLPAGNMDLKRLKQEVLEPYKVRKEICYRKYNCHSGIYEETVCRQQGALTILEGSYSQHPDISSYSDLKIFVTCEKEEQRRRLMEREGERYIHFEQLWIPKEEAYFSLFQIQENCDWVLDTTLGI